VGEVGHAEPRKRIFRMGRKRKDELKKKKNKHWRKAGGVSGGSDLGRYPSGCSERGCAWPDPSVRKMVTATTGKISFLLQF